MIYSVGSSADQDAGFTVQLFAQGPFQRRGFWLHLVAETAKNLSCNHEWEETRQTIR